MCLPPEPYRQNPQAKEPLHHPKLRTSYYMSPRGNSALNKTFVSKHTTRTKGVCRPVTVTGKLWNNSPPQYVCMLATCLVIMGWLGPTLLCIVMIPVFKLNDINISHFSWPNIYMVNGRIRRWQSTQWSGIN